MIRKFALLALIAILIASCQSGQGEQVAETPVAPKKLKIVSTQGTLTEIIVELGMKDQLVGVDVTSIYPEDIKELPSIGHQRSMTSEGIVALAPDVVVGIDGELGQDMVDQLEKTGVNVMLFQHEYTPQGVTQLIADVADSLDAREKAKSIIAEVEADFAKLSGDEMDVDVLFLYARGAGTLMAFGKDTQANSLIELTGANNVVTGYDGCKNLTPEALVEANPDVVVMFSSGMASLNGEQGVLDVPGMKQTKAGMNKEFLAYNGLYLLGFGPRSGKAILELNQALNEIADKKKQS